MSKANANRRIFLLIALIAIIILSLGLWYLSRKIEPMIHDLKPGDPVGIGPAKKRMRLTMAALLLPAVAGFIFALVTSTTISRETNSESIKVATTEGETALSRLKANMVHAFEIADFSAIDIGDRSSLQGHLELIRQKAKLDFAIIINNGQSILSPGSEGDLLPSELSGQIDHLREGEASYVEIGGSLYYLGKTRINYIRGLNGGGNGEFLFGYSLGDKYAKALKIETASEVTFIPNGGQMVSTLRREILNTIALPPLVVDRSSTLHPVSYFPPLGSHKSCQTFYRVGQLHSRVCRCRFLERDEEHGALYPPYSLCHGSVPKCRLCHEYENERNIVPEDSVLSSCGNLSSCYRVVMASYL